MNVRTKPEKLGSLIKKVDEQVSLFVRLSAADENGTIRCISCGQGVFYKEADCCHFKDRDNMATRFYLPNLAAGCQDCNRFDHYEHLKAWRDKMTSEQEDHLDQKANSQEKFTRYELGQLLIEFTEKVKQLRKQKHL
jgi:hypothetical protein